jgi:hypothetical protein
MKLSRLLTYSFAPNVGSLDRVFRLVSGALIGIAPWTAIVSLPTWASVLISAAGVAWLITGLVSRCGMYYTFGFSTLKSKG